MGWVETTSSARTKKNTKNAREIGDFATFFVFFGGKNTKMFSFVQIFS